VNFVAKTISIIVHPLLMTSYLFIVLFLFIPSVLLPISASNFYIFLGAVFSITMLFPFISIGILKLTGSISSIELPNRKERIMPFIFISFYYGMACYLFYIKIPVNPIFINILAVTCLLVVIATIMNFFIKLSIHSMAVWGSVGMMLWLNRAESNNPLLIPIVAMVLIAGTVMSARLYLKAHTMEEVLVGSFTGFLVSFMAMLILFK
jgi:hypothetical protein